MPSEYDDNGNVTATTDARNQTTHHDYDPLNRRTAVTDPLEHSVTTAYDAVGNATATTDPMGARTTFTYDALNQQTRIDKPDGTFAAFSYTAAGQLASENNPLDHPVRYTYDTLGRRTRVEQVRTTSPTTSAFFTLYRYDRNGNVTYVIDPENNRTGYAYDALNRLIYLGDPREKNIRYRYDAQDRLTLVTDRDGDERLWFYDKLGRLIEQRQGDSSIFRYDAADHVTYAANANANYTLAYDVLGRLSGVDGNYASALSFGLDYTYDGTSDLRAGLTDSFGGTITSEYDDAGRLSWRRLTAGSSTLRVDRDSNARGQLTELRRSGNADGSDPSTRTAYSYDDAGHTTGLNSYAGATPFITTTLSYDAFKRLVREDTTVTEGRSAVRDYAYEPQSAGIMGFFSRAKVGPMSRLETDGETYTSRGQE